MVKNEVMMEHKGIDPACYRRGKLKIHADKPEELKGITDIYMRAGSERRMGCGQ